MSTEMDNLLAHLNSIQPLAAEEEQAIRDMCTLVHCRAGEDLQPMGQACKTIYFVKEGAARIYYLKDDKDVTEYFAFANDLIIRAESLFTGQPSHKAIQAIRDTSFIGIPAVPLFRLFDRYPTIERLFRKIVERSYVETLNRLESLQFHTAEERYTSLIQASPDIVQTIPLKHIASYLGITQVSLSRIRSRTII